MVAPLPSTPECGSEGTGCWGPGLKHATSHPHHLAAGGPRCAFGMRASSGRAPACACALVGCMTIPRWSAHPRWGARLDPSLRRPSLPGAPISIPC
eukprot:245182-Chlamydomonas_euryale.AAC.1